MAVQDGKIHTQAECDAYLATINELKHGHDWMSGVEETYQLRTFDWDGSALVNEQKPADATYTGNGAHGYYPEWRAANPDVTAVGSHDNSVSYDQWNSFTNERDDWDAEVVQLGKDIGIMENHHAEMIASIPE